MILLSKMIICIDCYEFKSPNEFETHIDAEIFLHSFDKASFDSISLIEVAIAYLPSRICLVSGRLYTLTSPQ